LAELAVFEENPKKFIKIIGVQKLIIKGCSGNADKFNNGYIEKVSKTDSSSIF
jgi:hypothetical protein